MVQKCNRKNDRKSFFRAFEHFQRTFLHLFLVFCGYFGHFKALLWSKKDTQRNTLYIVFKKSNLPVVSKNSKTNFQLNFFSLSRRRRKKLHQTSQKKCIVFWEIFLVWYFSIRQRHIKIDSFFRSTCRQKIL